MAPWAGWPAGSQNSWEIWGFQHCDCQGSALDLSTEWVIKEPKDHVTVEGQIGLEKALLSEERVSYTGVLCILIKTQTAV